MTKRVLLASALAALVLAGCALDRTGLAPTVEIQVDSGGAPVDSGLTEVDSGAPIDSGGIAVDSGGVSIDAGQDGGACVARCEGSVAIACGISEVRLDCAASGMVCTGAGMCMSSMLCAPSTTRCSADGSAVLSCDGTGTVESSTLCERGCEAGVCRAADGCTRTLEAAVAAGSTTRYDLCGESNDTDHAERGGACSYQADGEDVLVPFDVSRAGNYRFEIADAPGGAMVDPVVFVRAVCDSRESEVGCNDDRASADLNSRLDVALEPGQYFVIVDSVDTSAPGNGCGVVDLTVTRM